MSFLRRTWRHVRQDVPVGGLIAAGQNETPIVYPGAPVRIFTGAAIPPGGSLFIQEDIKQMADGKINWDNPVKQHANIRLKGEDVVKGAKLLDCGDMIDAPALLSLANLRVQKVSVFRRPRIALATSGSELIAVDGPEPTRSQVVDGNRVFLSHQLGTDGDLIKVFPRLQDTADAVEHFINNISSFDVVVCCGGMSVGQFDILGQKLRGLGHIMIDRVAVQTRKSLFSLGISDKPYLLDYLEILSTFVGYELFVRPLLRLLTGETKVFPGIQAPRCHPLSANGSRLNFLRAHTKMQTAYFPTARKQERCLKRSFFCNLTSHPAFTRLSRASCGYLGAEHWDWKKSPSE